MLVVSAQAGAEHVLGLLEAGADGYLLKRSLPAALRAAVHRAAAGKRVLDPEPVRVVPAWATGKELAAALGLSPKTVASQRGRILDKLGAVNSAAAVRSAVAQVLLAAPLGRIGGDRTFAAD